ncbi:MAG: 16S rRNA processing protein RimM [Clostridiales bacterium]|nr:16S rRNA processing protein RimM [Clostridiales bacterium]
MIDTLKIGLIVKPQGIRGELKVQPLTDDINRFKNLKEVIIEDNTYRVSNTVIAGNMVLVSLDSVIDRNTAETFRGKFLRVTRENAIPLQEGRYFITDIIGCALMVEEQKIGEIIDVFSARTDIFTVKCLDGKIMRFPFLKDAIINIDVQSKKIVANKKRLSEISCYED